MNTKMLMYIGIGLVIGYFIAQYMSETEENNEE